MEQVIAAYREVGQAIAAYDQFVFGHAFGTVFDGARANALALVVVEGCDLGLLVADRVPDIQYFQQERANFKIIAN